MIRYFRKIPTGIFMSLLSLISCVDAIAQKAARISGRISTDADSIKLMVRFYPDMLHISPAEATLSVLAPVDKKGNFSVTLPAITFPGRLLISENRTGTDICKFAIVEPGDNIYINAVLTDNGNQIKINYTGKGSEKYKCNADIQSIPIWGIGRGNNWDRKKAIADSLVEVQTKVLSQYKGKISNQIFGILSADITGRVYSELAYSNLISFLDWGTIKPDYLDPVLQKGIASLSKQDSTDLKAGYFSQSYVKFFYDQLKLELLYKTGHNRFGFRALFELIKNTTKDKFREKLISYALMNNYDLGEGGIFSDLSDGEFASYFKEAATIVKTPTLRKFIDRQIKSGIKGAVAYDFTLPADSSLRKVSLSDFKGKVVLLDIWAYQCTGCYKFSNLFHEKVYPLFKNNPDFVVISAMVDMSNRKGYMQRLRSEGGYVYTSPDYINLYGGREVPEGRRIEQAYNISAYPFIRLIDRQGRIFSVKVPTPIEEKQTDLIESLIQMINGALKS